MSITHQLKLSFILYRLYLYFHPLSLSCYFLSTLALFAFHQLSFSVLPLSFPSLSLSPGFKQSFTVDFCTVPVFCIALPGAHFQQLPLSCSLSSSHQVRFFLIVTFFFFFFVTTSLPVDFVG